LQQLLGRLPIAIQPQFGRTPLQLNTQGWIIAQPVDHLRPGHRGLAAAGPIVPGLQRQPAFYEPLGAKLRVGTDPRLLGHRPRSAANVAGRGVAREL
jgi:hypothetical protein